MARFGLARHVFVCRDEDHVVVLDLKRDRYFALEAAKTAVLTQALPGWPVAPPDGPVTEAEVIAVAAPLLRRGWLLEPPGTGKDPQPVQAPPPVTTLSDELGNELGERGGRVGVGTVYAFVMASVFAKFALRFWRFERVVQRVAARNARHRERDPAQHFDPNRVRELMSAFARLRVFLFSTREECLHDSLAALEFLARHDLFPSWIFGVRARPFAAHCWVQYDGVVCNDTVEHVSGYTPIMVV
jgi:hypothetical protein